MKVDRKVILPLSTIFCDGTLFYFIKLFRLYVSFIFSQNLEQQSFLIAFQENEKDRGGGLDIEAFRRVIARAFRQSFTSEEVDKIFMKVHTLRMN